MNIDELEAMFLNMQKTMSEEQFDAYVDNFWSTFRKEEK